MNAKLTLGLLFFLPAMVIPVTPAFGQPWRTLGDARATFPLDSVAVSPDGKLVLTADNAGAIKRVLVLDATNGKTVRELDDSGRQGQQVWQL